jgi:hypothetical protein
VDAAKYLFALGEHRDSQSNLADAAGQDLSPRIDERSDSNA